MLVAGAAGLNWDWRCSYKKGIAWMGLMKMIPDSMFTPEARATSSDYSARFFPKESRERVLANSSPDKKLVIALN
jgi:hypothetical protein